MQVWESPRTPPFSCPTPSLVAQERRGVPCPVGTFPVHPLRQRWGEPGLPNCPSSQTLPEGLGSLWGHGGVRQGDTGTLGSSLRGPPHPAPLVPSAARCTPSAPGPRRLPRASRERGGSRGDSPGWSPVLGAASRAGHVASPEVPRPPPREGRASPVPGRLRPFPQHLGPWGRPPRSNPVCGHGPRGAVGKGDGGGRADSAERSPDVTSPPRVTKLVQLRWFL